MAALLLIVAASSCQAAAAAAGCTSACVCDPWATGERCALKADDIQPSIQQAAVLPTVVQTAWQERELGGLITWGMNVPLANSSSKLRHSSRPTTGVAMCSGCSWQLDSLPPASEFDPSGLDVPGWVSAAKSFGARYLVLAVNHGGGFALWPSNATVPRHGRYNYSTVSSTGAWVKQHGRDIVAQFVAECRRQDILPGFYVSYAPTPRHPDSSISEALSSSHCGTVGCVLLRRIPDNSLRWLFPRAGQHRRKHVPQYRCRCQLAQCRPLGALLPVPPQPARTGQHHTSSDLRRGARNDERAANQLRSNL